MIANYDFKEMENMRYWAPPSSWSDEKKKEITYNRIFSNEWLGAEKFDGYFCRIIKEEDGSIFLQSRTRGVNGSFPEKHEWVPHLQSFFDALPNGTCLLGELYLPSAPGSSNITKILGCLKEKAIARQEKEKLSLYIFDVLAYNNELLLEQPFEKRIDLLDTLRFYYESDYNDVKFAKYYDGKDLWKHLGEILDKDGEGIVMTRKKALYQPNKRPSKDCQKVKKEIKNTIDCFFTGNFSAPTKEYNGIELENWEYWVNLQTEERIRGKMYSSFLDGAPIEPVTKPFFNKWAGSLEIGLVKNNKVIPIGLISGVSDEIKANPKKYKGKVIEISCMEILRHKDGRLPGLRHAKIVQFREDKNWKECTWEQIED